MSMPVNEIAKYRSRTYPPGGSGSFHLGKDDGAGLNDVDISRKNIAPGPIPPAGRGTGLRQKDDGGGINDPRSMDLRSTDLDNQQRKIVAAGPLSPLQDLYPPITPGGHASFHLLKNDGGRSCRCQLTRSQIEKRYRCRTYTPQAWVKI
jgi:hypothetical protein